MAKLVGRNALVYIGGTEMPQRNSWSLSFDRELSEARVFGGDATLWVESFAGFMSWSGSVGGYYDDSSDDLITQAMETTVRQIVLYESRNALTRYWYGNAWVNFSQDVGVDDVISVDADFTGDSKLTRIAS